MLPIFIGLTLARDEKKIWINANYIGEIMDANAVKDEDEEYAYMEGTTLVFIQGRPGMRVKETPDEIRTMIRNAERDTVSLIVQRLHAQGFIGH